MKTKKKRWRESAERGLGALCTAACFAGALAMLMLEGCDRRESGGGNPERDGGKGQGATPEAAAFVGAKVCAECHEAEFADWKGSYHDLAMQPATEETVLGDFNDASFTHFGDTTRFFRRDGAFLVNATGPDGEKHDYPVEYVFGVYPLQQYLIPFPGGRLQALFVCWDSRPKEEGGQRWYHLYPDEAIPHTDLLHWTGQHFNWNYMCADCHSTNLRKNFDVAENAYHTTFAEMNVSCEACHGPGSAHVDWAKTMGPGDLEGYKGDKGLAVVLKEPEEGAWQIDPATQQPVRSRPLESTVQVETCAPCHSHRRPIGAYAHRGGGRYLDTHLPSVLSDVLYHQDGQIKEEVYVYGSFTQSRMFHKDVRCSDCHNPHSLKLHAPDNALCVRCHVATKYNTPEHHFHPVDSTGALCVECHMPAKNYMVVDARRDHSIRIPRPDLSEKLGSPNACTDCHKDQTQAWAANAFREWWGEKERAPHYGEILQAARQGGPEVPLVGLVADAETPALVRATALSVIGDRPPTQAALQAAVSALADPDPIVRQSALGTMVSVQPAQRLDLAGGLLSDPVRAVRIEAARVLAAVPAAAFTPERRAAFDKAAAEFIDAQMAVADRAGAHTAIGDLYVDRGDAVKAEEAYRTGMRIEPTDVPVRVRLEELLYRAGRAAEGEPVLRDAVRLRPDVAIAHEALGRNLIRQKRYAESLPSLKRAVELAPADPRVHYFYGVALNDQGRFAEALPYLEKAVQLDPGNHEYRVAAVTICKDNGDWETAERHADELVSRFPGVPGFVQLRESIRAREK